MDTIVRELLENDEVDSMHSGADLEALTAALNRDIGMDMPASSISQPSDPPGTLGALVTDSNSITNQLIDEWQASSQEDQSAHQTVQLEENKDLQAQEQYLTSQEQPSHQQDAQQQQQIDSESENEDLTIVQENLATDHHQPPNDQVVEKNLVLNSQEAQDKLQHSEDQQETFVPQLSDKQSPNSGQGKFQNRRMVPFTLLVPFLRPNLDKDRSMQFDAVHAQLRNNEISKANFLRVIRNIVGDQMFKQAAQKLQQQMASKNLRALRQQSQAPQQQISHSAQNFVEGQSISQVQRGQASTNMQQLVEFDVWTDIVSTKSNEVDSKGDIQGIHHARVASSSMNMVKQEKEVAVVAVQGVNKQHQNQPSSLFPGGAANSQTFPRPPGSTLANAKKSQSQGSQIRQLTPQGILPPQSGTTQPMNMMTMKYEVQSTVTDASKHKESVSHLTSHLSSLQNQVTWQTSTSKEQKGSLLSTMSSVKQEVVQQTTEQENRPHFATLQDSSGNQAVCSLHDETDEKQPSRTTFSATTTTTMTPQLEPTVQIRSQIPSSALPVAAGSNSKTPPKKPSVGQKKPLETQGTPPASKKQKVSGTYHDQSIEQLNDVTAVSGVNLREEEEQLLSAPKEESRASEATRKVVQEEEERLILLKGPLHKKLVDIMAKCGIKNMNSDVERCLSLCVEERLRGLVSNLIRVSRQRVDMEKARHRIVLTSDVRRQIMTMNKRAKEEWERKQAEESEKNRKQSESEGTVGADGEKEKDEGGRLKSLKSKEEDDKMRTTAANVAARAAVGGDDMLSKWQLMAEQARQKREGSLDTVSGALPGRSTSRKSLSNTGRTSRENQEVETRNNSLGSAAGGMRKFGRIMSHPKVIRSISVRDITSVLEREPQMSKSSLIYRLYDRMLSNSPSE